MPLSEFELIERYFRNAGAAREDVALGVGDDAALVIPGERQLALAVDTLVADIHFPADAPAAAVGHKALAVNLSDLAAMGAEPAWALLSLTLPAVDEDWLGGFAEGFSALARGFGVALIGGDTSHGPMSITVQVTGYADCPLRRDGARPGDLVFVSGSLGDAAAGLRCWRAGEREAAIAPLLERLHRPQPRIALGCRLAGLASAAVDVSDGLLADAGHIAKRSGVRLVLETGRLPLSEALRARVAAEEARRMALTGGDDYELCFTAAPERAEAVERAARAAGVAVTRIGRAEAGAGSVVVDDGGRPITMRDSGYRHF